ncbi:DNA mismatch repair protein MutT [Streptomyces hygroscopicus subsp. hygroscopicus]|uniref:NUDIX hydrolase n=1 Tax=Streptomyces sp. KHY 26 TaxID=3097359 RepID=UPI0024A19F51|nr:NUDIX hydrolase [Streptomyces hygroscopicus]GLX50259.1 DNA mismatch repair protein MutT [Streptomyces hygroscopicus subsp. hygroscopicus]
MPGPPSRPLAADQRGNVLASFTFGTEDVLPGGAPTPMALTALWHRGAVVMVHDRFRSQWELPGGLLEPGESPRQAAVRELAEESGQIPDDPLLFVGYAEFLLGPARRAEYGALFTGRALRRRRVETDDEIGAVRWWEPATPLPGRVSAIDAYLARLTLPDGPH